MYELFMFIGCCLGSLGGIFLLVTLPFIANEFTPKQAVYIAYLVTGVTLANMLWAAFFYQFI